MSFMIENILKEPYKAKEEPKQINFSNSVIYPSAFSNYSTGNEVHRYTKALQHSHYDLHWVTWSSPYYYYSPPYYTKAIKRKGGQIRFTSVQIEALEQKFQAHKYLSPDDRRQVANILRLSDRQVKTWFQNRRAKWRRNSCNKDETDQLEL